MQLLLNLQQLRPQLLVLLAGWRLVLGLQSSQDISKEQCADQQGGSCYVHQSAEGLC
jgi:hypothetical protein